MPAFRHILNWQGRGKLCRDDDQHTFRSGKDDHQNADHKEWYRLSEWFKYQQYEGKYHTAYLCSPEQGRFMTNEKVHYMLPIEFLHLIARHQVFV